MKRSFLMGIAIGGCLGTCLILMLLIRNTLQARPSDPLTPEVSIAEETTVEESTEFPADQNKTELSEEADAEPEAEEVSKEDLSEELKPAPKEEAALAFAGDVMFSEQYLAAYDQGGIGVLADEEIYSRLSSDGNVCYNARKQFRNGTGAGTELEKRLPALRVESCSTIKLREVNTHYGNDGRF